MNMSSSSRRVPLEKRKRTEISCDKCKSRKQKCHKTVGEEKCRHCQDHGYECLVTKPRKQRLYGSVEAFGTRLSLLEGLVKGLCPEADLSSIDKMRETASNLGIALPSGDETPEPAKSPIGKETENEELVHDQQGQGQYLGPASSYFFQMKLRNLVGKELPINRKGQIYLFGSNPADTRRLSTVSGSEGRDINSATPSIHDPSSPTAVPGNIDAPIWASLIGSYFSHVNVDFPVLHQASFLETYQKWRQSPSTVDRVWLCVLLCVLILSRRVSTIPISEEQEEIWWRHVQSLFPVVIFTSNITSIQVLMLASLHLHNTSHRDTCWTLTGAAVRVAFAVGLHRDQVDTNGTPLIRELRKRLWWTLYAFEQVQVSSHDRPSAIDNALCSAGSPREDVLDMGLTVPPEYMAWSNRLVVMLSLICRALPTAAEDARMGPLSPAAGLLRDLSRWSSQLPAHLSSDAIDTSPPTFRRPLLLMHIRYHYNVSLIARYALLSRFTSKPRDNGREEDLPQAIRSMSDVCIDSGRISCQLLLKLDRYNQFNSVTWWDVYHLYSSTLVLTLSIICTIVQNGADSACESRLILSDCASVATRHLQNPMTPGTMHRWLVVVSELETMVQEFTQRHQDQQQKQQHHPHPKPCLEHRVSDATISSNSSDPSTTPRYSSLSEPSSVTVIPNSSTSHPQHPFMSATTTPWGAPPTTQPHDITSALVAASEMVPPQMPPDYTSMYHHNHQHHHHHQNQPVHHHHHYQQLQQPNLNQHYYPNLPPRTATPSTASSHFTPLPHSNATSLFTTPASQIPTAAAMMDPENTRFWQQIHWETIGNMLLGNNCGTSATPPPGGDDLNEGGAGVPVPVRDAGDGGDGGGGGSSNITSAHHGGSSRIMAMGMNVSDIHGTAATTATHNNNNNSDSNNHSHNHNHNRSIYAPMSKGTVPTVPGSAAASAAATTTTTDIHGHGGAGGGGWHIISTEGLPP